MGEGRKTKGDEKMEDRKADESDETQMNGVRPGYRQDGSKEEKEKK